MSILTPLDTALDSLLENLPVINGREAVELLAARGRILAESCVSEINVPPLANSAMDGYALRVKDLKAGSSDLEISQRIAAGDTGVQLQAGQAARIFTGAPVPAGADAVVMQENCTTEGARVTILQNVSTGENIRKAGEDIMAGDVIFESGHRIRPQDIGLMASIGTTQLQVRPRLKVALMTTGNELVKPGTELKPGQIYNSNFYTLCSLLQELNMEVLDLGIIGDDFELTRSKLAEAATLADCVISTGGVSVGEEDHIKAAVEAEGSLDLWKLAIKPGKPLACGNIAGTPFFGLPGNPVSAFVTFVLVVRPCLLNMLGCTKLFAQKFKINAGFVTSKSGERQQYLRSVMALDDHGVTQVFPLGNQSSGVAATLSNTAGLVVIPPYTSVAIGDSLDFIPFSELLN